MMKLNGRLKGEPKIWLLEPDLNVDPVVVCLQDERCKNCSKEGRASQVLA